MSILENYGSRERKNFAKIQTKISIPNLLEVQRNSYNKFLQMGKIQIERDEVGLQAAFRSVFPLEDVRGTCSLQFIDFTVGDWTCKCGAMEGLHHLRMNCRSCAGSIDLRGHTEKEVLCRHCGDFNPSQLKKCHICDEPVDLRIKYSVEECQERGMTYSVPLKVTFRLEIYDVDEDTGTRNIRDIKEEEVFFGDLPLMTDRGTFIINGTERVVVSQLHRSPGVFFQTGSNKGSFVAKVIPYRGSWVEFEYDQKEILYVRIDRKRRFLATVLLRAFGLGDNEELMRRFYNVETMSVRDGEILWNIKTGENLSVMASTARAAKAVKHRGKSILEKAKKVSKKSLRDMDKAGIESFPVDMESLEGGVAVRDVVDLDSGEVLVEACQPVDQNAWETILQSRVDFVEVVFPEREDCGPLLLNTIRKCTVPEMYPDRTWSIQEKAFVEFYRKMRPGDPPTLEGARNLFKMMFFDAKRYDFSEVGRLKFNTKLGTKIDLTDRVLSSEDYYKVAEYAMKLRKNIGSLDDIDHLGNRRVRSVGELLENQIRIGLVRMERAVKERMSVYPELATAMPRDLINAKPVIAAIFEFFGSSQLSQFMDQTNPLSEITHKRRLSALGPGGLSRERAGFEVRDVHTSHYGRICPIETPEGPNIGLISSMAAYAEINRYGFIESPYRKVDKGRVLQHVKIIAPGSSDFKVQDIVEERDLAKAMRKITKEGGTQPLHSPHAFYLTAWMEERYIIAQANAPFDEKGYFTKDHVQCRKAGEPILVAKDDVDYIDVSPKQLVSIAASLIPFLEHDDANRALMGSNMQRQAVPLVRPHAPFVGTGMEAVAARDSGAVIIAKRSGLVEVVDGTRIIVRVGADEDSGYEFGADVYKLTKFRRSNQSTCINQRPLVNVGQEVAAGQVLADGPCTESGELALGQNALVAFMPWRGYNYEDAILLSEKLVKEDIYTSIHIEEFDIEARDTKLGKEEITRDIPNISEVYLKNLDESGIIHIGARVKPGDILVGKVTPKGETQLTPEEKLLRAIFGEKSAEYRDASLYTPPGIEGTVVGIKIFTRRGEDKDQRTLDIENDSIDRMEKDLEDQIRIIREEKRNKIVQILTGKKLPENLVHPDSGEVLAKKGEKITRQILKALDADAIGRLNLGGKSKGLAEEVRMVEDRTRRRVDLLRKDYQEKIDQMDAGDDLPPGVIKMVKVFIAMKRKLQVGDKMAGRHGNKGVVARVLPEEDMPFMADGTPVQVVLNPLGVPSRMNVGQILETHMGWAASALGLHIATSVFDGAQESDIQELFKKADLPLEGKVYLRDGKTGDVFLQKVMVGYMYMLKLAHMVDDKIHARSIGPYSLITQQPLGGKAQFGGQRFGEMEVWALEAYGAGNILQEILTVKSDDVVGRTKMYETIVKGDSPEDPGLPESFNVLVKELQGLCLNVVMKELETEEELTNVEAEEDDE